MILRPLTLEDEAEALAAHSELAHDDFKFFLGYESGMAWGDYLAHLESEHLGINLPEGRVQANSLVVHRCLGRCSLPLVFYR